MAEAFLLKRFIKNRDGNFGIIFGLVLVPILGIIGAAVDYSSMISREAKIQNAADMSLLAAAKDASSSTEFYRLAENYLTTNLDGMEVETITKANPKNVTLTIRSDYETLFLGIIGQPRIKIEIYSEVSVDKFGRGSARNQAFETTALTKELDRLEAQLLKQLFKLPPREQEKARKRIGEQIAYLKKRASSKASSDEIYLSK
jgi:hypothetical protein